MGMTEDSRSPYERLRRTDAQNLLKAHGVQFRPGSPLSALIPLIQANNINPFDGIEWESIQVPLENGGFKIEKYPKRKVHYTAGRDINYDAEIEKRTKHLLAEKDDENKSLRDQVARLEAMVAKLLDKSDDLANKPFHELKKMAKERGHKIPITMKKPELIEVLRGQDPA